MTDDERLSSLNWIDWLMFILVLAMMLGCFWADAVGLHLVIG